MNLLSSLNSTILLLALYAAPVSGHARKHRSQLIPDVHQNIVTANVSIGGVDGFASTYGLEYERFLTKKSLFSILLWSPRLE